MRGGCQIFDEFGQEWCVAQSGLAEAWQRLLQRNEFDGVGKCPIHSKLPEDSIQSWQNFHDNHLWPGNWVASEKEFEWRRGLNTIQLVGHRCAS